MNNSPINFGKAFVRIVCKNTNPDDELTKSHWACGVIHPLHG